uniref:mitoferrin-1 isoform X3 n=1 Tax=Podarcis muralis TaxID=64176 RepID=UPI00109FF29A|nr:mitoferrin-1 isoform X3 [Podarcis muralis]
MPSCVSASQRLAQLFVAVALATSFPGEWCFWGWPVGQYEEAPLFGVGQAAQRPGRLLQLPRGLPKKEERRRGLHKGQCLKKGMAGSLATLLHDGVMNPAEVVKQRMQMYNSPYKTVLECIRTVHRTEGMGAFYRSYSTQLTMNIPFQAIHFMTYEFMQEQINPCRQYNPSTHIISGAVAGAVAAAATTPLDVCKTLLNTQENVVLSSVNVSGHLSGMANAFRTVYQLGGIAGYFKGVQARVIYQMPSTAISWSVYEFFKYALTKRELEKGTPC